MPEANKTGTPTGNMSAAAAHDWLRTAITEFHGALAELAEHMGRETKEAADLRDEVSATLNLFMVDLMRIAQHGAALPAAEVPEPGGPPVPLPEPPPEGPTTPVPVPEPAAPEAA